MLSSGQRRHVSLVSCGSIMFSPTVLLLLLMLGCTYSSPQPGRKLIWYSFPRFLIHTDLTSNPASFYLLSNLVEASNSFDRVDVHKPLREGNKRRHFKKYGEKVNECTSDLSLCRLLLPEEYIRNHRACLT